jgi:nicotinamidase-related amidase
LSFRKIVLNIVYIKIVKIIFTGRRLWVIGYGLGGLWYLTTYELKNFQIHEDLSDKSIKPALLIIDVQNRYLPSITQRDKDLGFYFINLLIGLFRDNGFPVIRIYHTNAVGGPKPGTDEFEYPDAVMIRPEDPQIIKTYSDSFNKTQLRKLLEEKGSNTVFICGQSAVGCVMATFIGAMNNDLKPFIVKDAIMCHNTDFTRNVEMMFDAVSYNAVKLIVESAVNSEK